MTPPQDRSTARLVVAVATYRRNDHLTELLPMLDEHASGVAEPAQARILVVDNDPDQGARQIVDTFPSDRVSYVHEPTPGIAAARNRALQEAYHDDAIVFIDDDERPCPGWLDHLLHTWQQTGAAAVAGRVVPRHAQTPDAWIEAGRFFQRRNLPTGTRVPTAPAGNLLLDLATLRALDLRFDPRTALIGGEDTVLTQAIDAAGHAVVICGESIVEDLVPPERATRRWVLTRAFGHGTLAGLMSTGFPETQSGLPRRIAVGAGGAARVVAGLGRSGYGVVRGDLAVQARGARLAARGAGIVVGAAGHAYVGYGRTDGSGRRPRPVRPAYPPQSASAAAPATSSFAAGALRWPLGSMISVRTETPQLALTFDDGPDPLVTPQILDVLAEHHARATFFVLLGRARRHPDVLRRIVAEGHEIALHGIDHRRLTTLPTDEAAGLIRRGRDELSELLAAQLPVPHPVRYFRPAYGAQGWAVRRATGRSGLIPVLWSATTWDWKDVTDTERLAKAAQAGPGDIVLAHDGRAQPEDGAVEPADRTEIRVDKPALLSAALTAWSTAGLQVVTVSELLDAGPPVWRLVRPHRSDLPQPRDHRTR